MPGAVEQGKTSDLMASVRDDLRRERCAIIVLDPKGDAADAALSVVRSASIATHPMPATDQSHGGRTHQHA